MITKVTKADVLIFSSRIVAGALANPVNGNLAVDSYARQQLITQAIQDTINAFLSMGIVISDN